MHALLQRQIARHLGGVDVTAAPWAAFLEAVNQSYIEAEIDRNLVETAMEISSHELLQANAELRALIQVFPDLILHVDADGHIASSRGRAARTFGARPGGIVGQVLRDLFPESEREAFDAALVTARHSGEVVTLEHTSHDGSLVVHEMRLASLGEGGVVAIVRDVTDTRRSEELRLAKEGAEAASRAKSAFLANMSHELRTPLNAILGYSEMLAEEAPDTMREDLMRIHGSGRHLLQLLNAMLDIARIEAGMVRVEVDGVDVAAVVQDAVASVRAAADAKHLPVRSTIEPGVQWLQTDRAKLVQVLAALAGNAVKFTEQGSVEIAVRAERRGDRDGVLFAVTDTGIGLAADHLSRLFRDFAQVDESTTRRFGGTGLGLALCRRLCSLIDGQVSVRSTYGAGSTFSVWVPRLLETPAEAAETASTTGDAR